MSLATDLKTKNAGMPDSFIGYLYPGSNHLYYFYSATRSLSIQPIHTPFNLSFFNIINFEEIIIILSFLFKID